MQFSQKAALTILGQNPWSSVVHLGYQRVTESAVNLTDKALNGTKIHHFTMGKDLGNGQLGAPSFPPTYSKKAATGTENTIEVKDALDQPIENNFTEYEDYGFFSRSLYYVERDPTKQYHILAARLRNDGRYVPELIQGQLTYISGGDQAQIGYRFTIPPVCNDPLLTCFDSSYGLSNPSLEVPDFGQSYQLKSSLVSGRIGVLKTKKTVQLLPEATITDQTTYNYAPELDYLLRKVEQTREGELSSLTLQYTYPKDYPNEPLMQKMVASNRLNERIETSQRRGKKVIQKQKLGFTETMRRILSHKIQTAKGDHDLEDRLIYDHYDSYGNVLELHQADDPAHTVTLWGYSGQYPIARIDNATYTEVQDALGLSGDQEPNETHLAAIDALRNSKTDWMITTYEHFPLVGVKSITPPNGVTTHYEYDDFNRLKTVKNKDQQLLKEYNYHYALEQ